MKETIIAQKSYQFALESVQFYKVLREHKVSTIPNQFLRSATSVGANVQEAYGSISDREFHSKLSIANKEARESHYWLLLIRETTDIDSIIIDALLHKADEMIRLLTSATKTLDMRLNGDGNKDG